MGGSVDMSENVKIPSDGERLKRALDRFNLIGGRTPAGTFLAYSETEPLFCYERDTVEELAGLVVDTLRSYARVFYQVDLQVQVEPESPTVPVIPVERIDEPNLRLVPFFEESRDDRELAGIG